MELFGWIERESSEFERGAFAALTATVQVAGGGVARLRVESDGSFGLSVGDRGAWGSNPVIVVGTMKPGGRTVFAAVSGDEFFDERRGTNP